MGAPKGKDNPRWDKGASEYPNHLEMKRNRLIKLKEAGNKCEVCGGEAYCIHHLDGSKDNHSLDNLAVLCKKCHRILHNGRENYNFSEKSKTSKYIREYGMTLDEMCMKYGGVPSRFRYLHKMGELHKFIEEQEKEESEVPY